LKLYYATSDFKNADVITLGIPYDRTSSFLPGSRFGPEYIRLCSENIEDYSPYQDKSLNDVKIHDAGDIFFETQEWQKEIHRAIDSVPSDKKLITLGGEHTITLPVVEKLKEEHNSISVIQFDAHCDLRDEYLGEKICHATVMKRISEIVGIDNLFQFGIRSGTREEFSFSKNIYRFSIYEYLPEIIAKIQNPIYVSIDVDVLDPGIMPAVSTPEPGGINYKELIDSLLLLNNTNIIGVDLVEYNPLAATPWASGSAVAEVLRELILILK
jgi:agmatinase